MKKTMISVIIPSYNRRHCILDAVKSVLNQKVGLFDFEIIISDDGSTDNTSELFENIKDKRIRYFYNEPPNKGVNIARNFGIKKVRGDYVLFLDSDDVLTKDAFEIMKRSEKNLRPVNFFGTAEKNGRRMYSLPRTGFFNYEEWLCGKYIKGEYLNLVRKDVFKKYLFDDKLFCFESFFWNSVIKEYGVFVVDAVCRLYSFEEENRVTKELLLPEKAKKRYFDYEKYIGCFGNDYLRYHLYHQYGDILFRAGLYAVLANEMKKGRALILKSLRYSFGPVKLATLFMSYLGNLVFIRMFNLLLRFKKV